MGAHHPQSVRRAGHTPNSAQSQALSALGGEGNRTPVPRRSFGSSPGAAGGVSRLEAPTGGGPLGQSGRGVRRRPPDGAASVSLLTTPGPRPQADRGGRLPNYLGSERVFSIGACISPGF